MSSGSLYIIGYGLFGFFISWLIIRGETSPVVRKRWIRVSQWVFSLTTLSFYLLGQIWYQDMEQTSWHWFNDGMEWRGMDKLCHIWWGYGISRILSRMIQWTGLSHQQSVVFGALGGFMLVGGIEILDGTVSGYGASYWDLLADGLGSLLSCVQIWVSRQFRFTLKMEAWLTSYAALRPNLLGDNEISRIIKDYNGMTFWIGYRWKDLPGFGFMPGWILLSVGYGAGGMNGAHQNVPLPEHFNGPIPPLERFSYIAISLDIDWEHFKFKHSWINQFLFLANHFKVPFPSYQFSF